MLEPSPASRVHGASTYAADVRRCYRGLPLAHIPLDVGGGLPTASVHVGNPLRPHDPHSGWPLAGLHGHVPIVCIGGGCRGGLSLHEAPRQVPVC